VVDSLNLIVISGRAKHFLLLNVEPLACLKEARHGYVVPTERMALRRLAAHALIGFSFGFSLKGLIVKRDGNSSHFNRIASLKLLLSARHFGAVYPNRSFSSGPGEEIPVFSMVDRGSGVRSEPASQSYGSQRAEHLKCSLVT
jgi:hypothetical protein